MKKSASTRGKSQETAVNLILEGEGARELSALGEAGKSKLASELIGRAMKEAGYRLEAGKGAG